MINIIEPINYQYIIIIINLEKDYLEKGKNSLGDINELYLSFIWPN
jgi:hypothetical protein